jgi:ABC-2 type transport system permease protein
VPEWLVVARREFAERVRTIWFAIVTVLGPVLLIALMVVPAWLAASAAEDRTVIQVVDQSGRNLYPGLVRYAALLGGNLDLQSVPPGSDEAMLLRRIREEKINGFLVIPQGVLHGAAATYRGDNATNLQIRGRIMLALNEAAREERARDAGIALDTFRGLGNPPIDLVARPDTGRGEGRSAESSLVAGYAAMFILYVSILIYAVNVMRSVIQEKTSRVVEIIVSAVKPRALMLGKVFGVGAVGLLQLSIWCAVALVMVRFRGEILGLFGIAGATSAEIPPLTLVDVVVVLTYFALGYFFYAGIYAAIGAMVNSDQEGQQLQTPVVILIMLPVACVQIVANDPRGAASQALTMIPFSSPVLMPMRYLLGGATWLEIAASLAILALFLVGAVALAGRIYRVGILMYGKRPSLRELARWLRYS